MIRPGAYSNLEFDLERGERGNATPTLKTDLRTDRC